MLRWPAATRTDAGDRIVLAGEPEEVLLAGLIEGDQSAATSPTRVHDSVGDAFDDFTLLASLPHASVAEHLEAHVRRYGISELCAEHGLPVWHEHPSRSGPESGDSCPTSDGVVVAHALTIARFLDSTIDAAVRIRRRQPVPESQVLQLLTFMTAHAHWLDGELAAAGGQLRAARRRQVVALAVEGFLDATAVRLGVSWVAHKTPTLVTKSSSHWGVFALELARRLDRDGEPAAVWTCESCGEPVRRRRRPREGDRVYCQRPECQRTRWRRNKARQRTERGD